MAADKPCILMINGGWSSIKFALYQTGEPLERRLHGNMDRIGLSGTTLTFKESIHSAPDSRRVAVTHFVEPKPWTIRSASSRYSLAISDFI
jgi:acetate kinase